MPDPNRSGIFFIKMGKHSCIIIFILLHFLSSFAQEKVPYRYDDDFPGPEFYQGRRAALRSQMPDSSLAILFSSPVRNRANDVDYPYHQNPNFFYLTGFTEADAMLLIARQPFFAFGKMTDEILFIAPKNSSREIWTGRMATMADAQSVSGISIVRTSTEFASLPVSENDFTMILYQSLPAGVIDKRDEASDLFNLVEAFKNKFSYPPSNGDSFRLSKMLATLREVKEPEELILMKKAIQISCEGHRAMMETLKPGMHEYEVQAAGEYVFKKNGAEDVGYPSICGGSENACILHYITNRRPLKEGDLILLDMGAEYHGYTADITRTLPASGKFTPEQRIIYDIVKEAQDSAFSKCKPGQEFRDPHRAAVGVIMKRLLEIGIISIESDYSKYFMHGTSHYLGLDVHDAGSFSPLRAGNVITVEPGIYIAAGSPCDPKWWNIGIRIEDDVLITATGYENLSVACPVTADEIEAIMQKAKN